MQAHNNNRQSFFFVDVTKRMKCQISPWFGPCHLKFKKLEIIFIFDIEI